MAAIPDTSWLSISYLALPKLLLSATDLVTLTLHFCCIPHSRYISPEVLVNCLPVCIENASAPTIPPWAPIPSVVLRPNKTSAFSHPHSLLFSHIIRVQRGQRVFGGRRSADRSPSAQ